MVHVLPLASVMSAVEPARTTVSFAEGAGDPVVVPPPVVTGWTPPPGATSGVVYAERGLS